MAAAGEKRAVVFDVEAGAVFGGAVAFGHLFEGVGFDVAAVYGGAACADAEPFVFHAHACALLGVGAYFCMGNGRGQWGLGFAGLLRLVGW